MNFGTKTFIALMTTACCISPSLPAQSEEGLLGAFKNGKIYIDERYRYEYVDQANFQNKAKASTLRNRIGFKSAPWAGFSFVAEWENVMNIGDDRFNNTINGRAQFPVVADVESHELNQLFFAYTGLPDTKLKVGRQVITFDNHRFIGHVGWRQNNQTFDAAVVQNSSIPGLTITYGYIDRVNRILGNDSPVGNIETETHTIHAAYKIDGIGTVKGYAYLLDHERQFNGLDSASYGAIFTRKQNLGQGYGLHIYGEYAQQEDYGDRLPAFEADYYHLALGVSKAGLKATIGYELLGTDNGVAFFTPLATGHIFNGFADQFLLATPINGLEDFYIDITYKVSNMPSHLSFLDGLLLKAQYHDFSSETGGIDFGNEFDFYAKLPLKRGLYIEGKYANYNAEAGNGLAPGRGGVDVEKITFGVGWKY